MPIIVNARNKIMLADSVTEGLLPAVFFCFFQAAVFFGNRRDAPLFKPEDIMPPAVMAYGKYFSTCAVGI